MTDKRISDEQRKRRMEDLRWALQYKPGQVYEGYDVDWDNVEELLAALAALDEAEGAKRELVAALRLRDEADEEWLQKATCHAPPNRPVITDPEEAMRLWFEIVNGAASRCDRILNELEVLRDTKRELVAALRHAINRNHRHNPASCSACEYAEERLARHAEGGTDEADG